MRTASKFQILMIVIATLSLIYLGWYHEVTHQVIFEYYGVDSEIHLFKNFPDMSIYPNMSQYGEKCKEECFKQQNMVDIVGYPILSCTLILTLSLMIIIFLLIEIKFKD